MVFIEENHLMFIHGSLPLAYKKTEILMQKSPSQVLHHHMHLTVIILTHPEEHSVSFRPFSEYFILFFMESPRRIPPLGQKYVTMKPQRTNTFWFAETTYLHLDYVAIPEKGNSWKKKNLCLSKMRARRGWGVMVKIALGDVRLSVWVGIKMWETNMKERVCQNV